MSEIELVEEDVIAKHLFFLDNFVRALDSYFSADISCCDSCHDEFLNFWPLANEANNYEFQRQSIDIDTFFSTSKLAPLYTEEEWNILKTQISCPRCGSTIDGFMWVYDLPFAYDIDTYQFESDIETLSELSNSTPFLLLKNEFANSIHNILTYVGENTSPSAIEGSLYRARLSNQISELSFDEFGPAPKKFIQEGRYNHAGQQVLYLASDIETCYHEIGSQLCYVAECKINAPIKILDLSSPEDSHTSFSENLSALTYSALLSKKLSTEGYNKPVYIFSRFVADCARYAGFDAIKYPSTKCTGSNYNLVILTEDIFTTNIEYKSLKLYDIRKVYELKLHT